MNEISDQPIIAARQIKKNFGGVRALRGVDFSVVAGEIVALIGQNGAGKSTLVKILNAIYPAGSFSGEIILAGQKVSFNSPSAARRGGIGYVPQEIEVLEQLCVAENVFAGQTSLGRGFVVHPKRLERRAEEIFADLGVTINPKSIVATLTSAQRHLVMIARALSMNPKVLMLDEPTSSFSGTEVEALFRVLRRLKTQGVAMVYITHRLPEVLEVCDRATVLRDGMVAAEFARDQFDPGQFILSMSGHKLTSLFPTRQARANARPGLAVKRLSVPGHPGAIFGVRDVSFSVARGEIVGLAGLLGSGRSEILHGIFGRIRARGQILVGGKPVSIGSPKDARRAGIGLLTEDRKNDGLLFNLPVGANITIGNLGPLSRGGVVSRQAERVATVEIMRSLDVKAASPNGAVAQLSGGNQQKLLFGRVLMRSPGVLMLDEPTKGVDAATRYEIYRLIAEFADAGVAVLVVASELEEIIGLCDRCLTLSDGQIVDEFDRGQGDEERILRAIAQAQAQARSLRSGAVSQ